MAIVAVMAILNAMMAMLDAPDALDCPEAAFVVLARWVLEYVWVRLPSVRHQFMYMSKNTYTEYA